MSSQAFCLFGSCYVLKSSPWQTGFVVLCGGKEEPRGAAMENTTPTLHFRKLHPTPPSIIVGITLKGRDGCSYNYQNCIAKIGNTASFRRWRHSLTFIGCPARSFRLKLLGGLSFGKYLGSREIPIVLNTFLLGVRIQCLQHNQAQYATLWLVEEVGKTPLRTRHSGE